MSVSNRLKPTLSTRTLALIPVAIVLNIVVGQLVSLLKLPVFLDSIGTILVALLAGPWAAGLTGLLSNLIWGLISSPVAAAFAPVAMVIGIVAGLLAQAGMFRSWWRAIISGVLIAVALSIVAVPIRVFMFGGITGSGADFITAYLRATGHDLFSAVIITVIGDNIIDKIVTAVLAWGIVRSLPARYTVGYPGSRSVTG